MTEAQIRARVGWLTRRRNVVRGEVAYVRALHLGIDAGLHGSDPDDRRVLLAMKEEGARRYRRFREDMEALGLDDYTIDNEWMSPRVR
jgi:hypothetical protein